MKIKAKNIKTTQLFVKVNCYAAVMQYKKINEVNLSDHSEGKDVYM